MARPLLGKGSISSHREARPGRYQGLPQYAAGRAHSAMTGFLGAAKYMAPELAPRELLGAVAEGELPAAIDGKKCDARAAAALFA